MLSRTLHPVICPELDLSKASLKHDKTYRARIAVATICNKELVRKVDKS